MPKTVYPTPDEALAIYQSHLDITSDAMIAGDFDRFRACFAIPHRVATQTVVVDVTSEQQMREGFARFTQSYAAARVTQLIRIARKAEVVAPGTIEGEHDSHQMNGANRVRPAYCNRVRLECGDDGVWRETHSANAYMTREEFGSMWTRVGSDPRVPDLYPDPERTNK